MSRRSWAIVAALLAATGCGRDLPLPLVADDGGGAGGGGADAAPDASPVAKPRWRIFVSRSMFAPQPPDTGLLQRADAICQQDYAACTFKDASLCPPATFKAWYSTSTINAPDRLTEGVFVMMQVGVPGAVTVFDGKASLAGTPKTPFDRLADGTIAPGKLETPVWTDTRRGTFDAAVNCGQGSKGWLGILGADGETWSFGVTTECTSPHPVYCFQVP